MHFPQSLRALLPALSVLLILSAGCREDAIIRTNLIPSSDSIATTSVDVGVTARTVLDDSVITAFLSLNNALIGANQGIGTVSSDPATGRTTAGLYFSVVPPTGGFRIDTAGLRIDSAILVLPYAGFSWGDTSNTAPGQRWRVFRVTDDLLPDSLYYSNRRAAVDRTTPLGSALVYRGDYAATRFLAGATRPAHLRLRLDTVAISSLLRNNPGSLGSAAAMRTFFKGFYIEPDAAQAASTLAYFRFGSGSTIYDRPGMLLYYRTPTRDDGLAVFSFNADSAAAYTSIERKYGGSPAANLFAAAADATSEVLLLQNEPGGAIDLRITGLAALEKAIYPKAQIILTKLDTLSAETFFGPERIFPVGIDEGGATYTILDRQPESLSEPLNFIDGRRRTVTVGNLTVTQYVVNVPRELQRAVRDGKSELHLRLAGATGYPGAYRLLAGGTGHGNWRIRVSVAYSRQ